ncbi:VIT1/CCC1 transporter family protein [Pontibacter fetidus]|uniref:Rubrerythrin family protein n=1 Tax=Pontibacter fetidus TaxID=2700082 RepID=A0A6B2GXI3_9BACT|nr:VIT1/CCC1 transporter family protein [Pontibacter fetidus]NDK55649.1 rubrerythrin family protein [Pontibacter fetidus]
MATTDPKAIKKYTDSLQTEVDAAYLYSRVAAAEEVPAIANMFRELGEIELEHVSKMTEKLLRDGIKITVPPPSWRARTLNRIGKLLGYGYIIGVLMDTEKSITAAQLAQKEKNHVPISGDEANHVKILQALLSSKSKVSGEHISRIEGKHKSIGGNALRAAVLGANDGLVSNMSLVMGVAGATDGQSGVLLAGMAGLLAGALSMALGEWISVKSSQELYERQMDLEMLEIETNPEGEMRELALIYTAKGIPEAQAHQMAAAAIQNTAHAHEILVKEELGINTEELKGSAWEAAITSFLLFAVGAILPVIPFFYTSGYMAIGQSLAFSTIGLFVIGAAITLFTGKSIWFSGFRQVLFGLAAAATTYVIGKLIGVSIAG